MGQLMGFSGRKVSTKASTGVSLMVVSLDIYNLWTINCGSRYQSDMPRGKGFLAFLKLNAQGLAALAGGALNGINPQPDLPVGPNEKPPATYVWTCMPWGLAAGTGKGPSPLPHNWSIYVRAVTDSGRQLLDTIRLYISARGSATLP